MGNLTLKENVKKNQEYFDNLQKCYNPTEVVSKPGPSMGRSKSSEALWDSRVFSHEQKLTEFLHSNLVKSTDDLVSNIKSSRTKMQNFNRTQSSFSILSGRDPVLTFVGKSETIDIDMDKVLKIEEEDGRFTRRGMNDETSILIGKKESPEDMQGVLKENCSERKLQFSLQSQDQLTVPEVKRRLRSPPPFHRDLLTPFNEDALTDEIDKEVNELVNLINVSKATNTKLKKFPYWKFPLSGDKSLQPSPLDFCHSPISHLGPRYLTSPRQDSPFPLDVELTNIERKTFYRRMSNNPSKGLTRTITSTAIIAPPDYRLSPIRYQENTPVSPANPMIETSVSRSRFVRVLEPITRIRERLSSCKKVDSSHDIDNYV